ncbi:MULTISPECIES: hypothetical protein [Streptomyces]|uniref:LPXTG-motif cell wall anchor domain-containing protein n=1 Tax=Streptomyces sudanensis TaxID=436397 RepID=A0ABY4TI81_9ACTN|nr:MULTISPECIES: hypothetical protein [Streptomyces]MCP9959876.1 hypothetical protein [Streptomyces sudanensis]MCP9988905.1 hypothetical protein [Streptomyces sudanensis]MCP9999719.1 hypothetical protein [Streptomyces sudanensis]URN18206.1 hypothetical protein MW084_22235 [Streptomyces sudanensis]
MKVLLWLLLVAAVAANVSTSFAFDGGKQVALSVSTGGIALASAACLFLTRDKRRAGRA